MAMSHADEAFTYVRSNALIARTGPIRFPVLVAGTDVRDYSAESTSITWFPYAKGEEAPPSESAMIWRMLWPLRNELGNRATFNGTYFSSGKSWWSWHQLPKDLGASELSIAFAEVATHNHFVLDRGGKVFKQTAPVIKLPKRASEDEHLALIGVLNSSTACFWLKQVCHNKGNGGIGGGIGDEAWEPRYQFNGSNIADFPLPAQLPLARGRFLDQLAQAASVTSPSYVAENTIPTARVMADARKKALFLRGQQIAAQEELDWETYQNYGVISEDLTYVGEVLPVVELGQRAFEIVLGRQIADGTAITSWFHRHGSAAVTEIPVDWPEDYRALVQRRIDAIESNANIRLLEKPEYKRRWAVESWEKQQERALREWLLDRLEERSFWFDTQGRPVARSIAQLADAVSRDAELVSVLALWDGTVDIDVTKALTKLLTDEAVPHLAAQRLKEPGLRKREAWEESWELQRREDAGEDVSKIPVPPKYASADFRKTSWWQARGKLDVPKERFILYPDAGRPTDPTLLVGWAGWDHVQQFLVLATIMDERITEGAGDDQLVPLVAGMAEVLPWVRQWHADLDPTFGMSMADFATAQLEERMTQLNVSTTDLKAWRPAPTTRGRRVVKENA